MSNYLDSARLAEIATRASPLAERLTDPVVARADGRGAELAERRLAAWRESAAGGDPNRFARRLAWSGLDEAAARAALGCAGARYTELPAWCGVLAEQLRAAEAVRGAARPPRFVRAETPVAFEDALAPLVARAGERLLERAGPLDDVLSEAAVAALERVLLLRLFDILSPTLQLEYSLHRARTTSRLGRLLGAEPADGRDVYAGFVRRLQHEGGWADLFTEYAVAARLTGTASALWIDACSELAERLRHDRAAIGHAYLGGRDPGVVATLQGAISDSHRGGRSAAVLAFSSGLRLVYKPKDLALERHWFALLDWVNERCGLPRLRSLVVLDRGQYGWVEHAARDACADEEAARRYFRRSGSLLCLVHALQGSDCHLENVIACGEQPVLIDLETVMQPQLVLAGSGGALRELVDRSFGSSVLRTGLLPRWLGAQGRVVDLSALGAVDEQQSLREVPVWKDVNRDGMEIAAERVRFRGNANVATLDGEPLDALAYSQEIEAGFRDTYRALLRHREELLAPAGPLAPFAAARIRFVHRSTRVYHHLMTQARQPATLRDGADHSLVLEGLARAMLVRAGRPPLWPLLAEELAAVENLDVPLFRGRADDDRVEIRSDEWSETCFRQSAYAQAVATIRSFDDEDLLRQSAYIRGAIAARGPDEVHRRSVVEESASEAAQPPPPVSAADLVAEAEGLAEALVSEAIGTVDTGFTWVSFRLMFDVQRFQVDLCGGDLYSGNAGIALFFGALFRATRDERYATLARATLVPVLDGLDRLLTEPASREISLGGGGGLGSVLYALSQVGDRIGDPELVRRAARASSLVTAERIAADRVFDVIGGSAGAILGLLALDRVRGGDDEAVDRALACGRHLLAHRRPGERGGRAWVTLDDAMLTGFAHGAAGIAYALLRLYGATGAEELRAAAEEAVEYESGCYSAERRNWPDLRAHKLDAGEGPSWGVAWCAGATGVGLARAGGLPWLDTAQVRADIEAALATTLASGCEGPDHLCCGNLGRVEMLVETGRRLGRPEIVAAGLERAARVVERARRRQTYLSNWNVEGVSMPGLFVGTSGAGLALLRLAHADCAPSALLWE
jgi:type 2 lantibiotic biosynthesis protein LanM